MSLSSDVVSPIRRRTQSKRTSSPAAELPPAPAPEETAPPLVADAPAPLAESPNEDAGDVARLSGRVRFARTLVKLTKAELARRVGVCLSAAVQWELPRGTSPNVNNLVKIATIAGVGFEWLATGRGSPKIDDPLQIPASAEDLDFEVRLLVAARGVARDRRDAVVDFVHAMTRAE